MEEMAKRRIRNGIKVLAFLLAVFILYEELQNLFVDDYHSETRISFHEFYETEENIDLVFIGSSHVRDGIDAVYLTEKLGKSCFNMGTSSQDLGSAYFLLLEILKQHQPERVYVEASLANLIRNQNSETAHYLIADYMKPSLNKVRYLETVSQEPHATNKYIPLCRSLNPLEGLKLSERITVWRQKEASDAYRQMQYEEAMTESWHYYAGRGGWKTTRDFSGQRTLAYSAGSDMYVTPERFDEGQLYWLEKIIELCQGKGIALTCMVMPYSDMYVAANPYKWDDCMVYLRQFCEDRQAYFVDFNCVSRKTILSDESYFGDGDHLNEQGNAQFNAFLAKYLSGEDDVLWYGSAAERIGQEQGFHGFVYEKGRREETGTSLTLTPVYSGVQDWQYQIDIVEDDSDMVVAPLGTYIPFGQKYLVLGAEYDGKRLRITVWQEKQSLCTVYIWL